MSFTSELALALAAVVAGFLLFALALAAREAGYYGGGLALFASSALLLISTLSWAVRRIADVLERR
jgi:hypothetical protein